MQALRDAPAAVHVIPWWATPASRGIEGVWVNGRRAWDGREPTGSRPGRVLER
ncbi:hypothetical protein GO496_15880 [Acidovorax citrulli]|nr:hypothetical protein [Paracidovorax citrulli]